MLNMGAFTYQLFLDVIIQKIEKNHTHRIKGFENIYLGQEYLFFIFITNIKNNFNINN